MRILSFLFFTVFSINGLTQDRLSDHVILHRTQTVEPALAVKVGQRLYFSEQTPAFWSCRGRNLYRVSEEGEAKLAEYSCILSLQTDGTYLYVEYKTDAGIRLDTYLGDRQTMENEQERAKRIAWVKFRLHQLGDKSDIENPKNLDTRWSRIRVDASENKLSKPPRFHFLLFGNTEEYLGYFSLLDPNRSSRALNAVPKERAIHHSEMISVGGDKTFLFRQLDDGVSLNVFNPVTGELISKNKAVAPPEVSPTEMDIESFAVLQIQYLTPYGDGFLFVEKHSLPGRPLMVYYFSNKTQLFQTVPSLPADDIKGLQAVDDGLLVTHAYGRSISWYGDKSKLGHLEFWQKNGSAPKKPDQCPGYHISKTQFGHLIANETQRGFVPLLSEIKGIESLACAEGSLAILISKEVRLSLPKNHLQMSIQMEKKFNEDLTNVSLLEPFAGKTDFLGMKFSETHLDLKGVPTLFVFKGNHLVLVRQPRASELMFYRIRVESVQEKPVYSMWLRSRTGNRPYEGYRTQVQLDGSNYESAPWIPEPEGSETINEN